MGIADFQRLRTQEYYYVDKTMYIPSMEDAGSYLFLVRPRRFGKSLFLSMLEAYYDCKQARDFDKLFGGLWIHDHPTEQHARFQVLRLDFSQVTGSIDVLEERFNNYCDQHHGRIPIQLDVGAERDGSAADAILLSTDRQHQW